MNERLRRAVFASVLSVACGIATSPASLAAPTSRPAVATQFPLNLHVVVLPAPIVFVGATAELDVEASNAGLYHLLDYLTARRLISLVRVEGHVAALPDAQALSEARALAVRDWLVANGVDPERLLAVGFGSTKPLVAGEAAAATATNTRIEIHNAQLRGRTIGGGSIDGGGRPATRPTSQPS